MTPTSYFSLVTQLSHAQQFDVKVTALHRSIVQYTHLRHTHTTYLRFPLTEATKCFAYFMSIASQHMVTVNKINPLTMWKEMCAACTTRSTVSSTWCSYVQSASRRTNSSWVSAYLLEEDYQDSQTTQTS